MCFPETPDACYPLLLPWLLDSKSFATFSPLIPMPDILAGPSLFLGIKAAPFKIYYYYFFMEMQLAYCVSLKCKMHWSDTFVYYNMITIIALADTFTTSYNYHFFFLS